MSGTEPTLSTRNEGNAVTRWSAQFVDHYALIAELTQSAVALTVVLSTMWYWLTSRTEPPTHMTDAFFIILGFYFGRTMAGKKNGV